MNESTWRTAFKKQPYHFIFLDISAPMTSKVITNITESLFNVVTLSSNVKGSGRLTELGISVTFHGKLINVVPLLSVKTNYTQFRNGINKILELYKSLLPSKGESDENLSPVFQDAVLQYTARCKQIQSANNTPVQMEIALVTSQSGKVVSKLVENATNSVEFSCIRKVQIVNLTDDTTVKDCLSVPERSPELWNSNSQESTGNEHLIGINIEIISASLGVFEPECFFKRWLHDYNTDTEHVRINFPFDTNSLQIKCDLQETALNPQLLPCSSQFFLSPDATHFQVTSSGNQNKAEVQFVPIYELNAVKVVKLSGVCESVLLGNPLVLYATHCWKMDWEDLETNQEMFIALNQVLSERESGLLLKCDGQQSFRRIQPSSSYHLQSHYFALPSRGGQNMLIRPLVTRELLLPGSHTTDALGTTKPSQKTVETIQNVLAGLGTEDNYDPLKVSCGLYKNLTSTFPKPRPQKRQHQVMAVSVPNAQGSFSTWPNHNS